MTSGAVTPGVAGQPRTFPQKSARPAGSAQPMFTDAKNRLTVLVIVASFRWGPVRGGQALVVPAGQRECPRRQFPGRRPCAGLVVSRDRALLRRVGDYVEFVAFRI